MFQKQLKTYESAEVLVTLAKENEGFGLGHNLNVANMKEKYLLLCNPDVLITKDSFQIMYDYLRSHPETIVAPKVLNADGSTQYLFRRKLTVLDYFLRFIPFAFIKKRFQQRLANFECRDLSDETQEVLFASGCFLMMEKEDFQAVKGFDSRFFMYFEDNDLCLRLRQAGKRIVYLPQAKITHFYGKGSHRSFKLFRIFITSMVKYFNKWGWEFY